MPSKTFSTNSTNTCCILSDQTSLPNHLTYAFLPDLVPEFCHLFLTFNCPSTTSTTPGTVLYNIQYCTFLPKAMLELQLLIWSYTWCVSFDPTHLSTEAWRRECVTSRSAHTFLDAASRGWHPLPRHPRSSNQYQYKLNALATTTGITGRMSYSNYILLVIKIPF